MQYAGFHRDPSVYGFRLAFILSLFTTTTHRPPRPQTDPHPTHHYSAFSIARKLDYGPTDQKHGRCTLICKINKLCPKSNSSGSRTRTKLAHEHCVTQAWPRQARRARICLCRAVSWPYAHRITGEPDSGAGSSSTTVAQ